jgi:hypothetical protein
MVLFEAPYEKKCFSILFNFAEFFKRHQSRPNSAPGFVLNNDVALVPPHVVTPGTQQTRRLAPAPGMSHYMMNLVPLEPAATMSASVESSVKMIFLFFKF